MTATDCDTRHFTRPRGRLQRRCGYCYTTGPETLSLCTACRVVCYCSDEHRFAHSSQHKEACEKVQEYRTRLADEEGKTRINFLNPPNGFATHAGALMNIYFMSECVKIRFFLADIMRKIGAFDGMHEALGLFTDMMRLDPAADTLLRKLIPPLMLQLGKDQDCYDFIRWYQTVRPRSDKHRGRVDYPSFDTTRADAFESPDYMLRRRYTDIFHCTNLIFLKLTILADVVNIRVTRKVLDGKLPVELWEAIELATLSSPISISLTRKSTFELVETECMLVRQVQNLGSHLRQANGLAIQALLSPDPQPDTPETTTKRALEETRLLLQCSAAPWCEIEGPLDLLRAAKDIAACDARSEVHDVLRRSAHKKAKTSRKTEEELLEDISCERIWEYLGLAVEDAGNLSSQRPSAVKTNGWRAMHREETDYCDHTETETTSDSEDDSGPDWEGCFKDA